VIIDGDSLAEGGDNVHGDTRARETTSEREALARGDIDPSLSKAQITASARAGMPQAESNEASGGNAHHPDAIPGRGTDISAQAIGSSDSAQHRGKRRPRRHSISVVRSREQINPNSSSIAARAADDASIAALRHPFQVEGSADILSGSEETSHVVSPPQGLRRPPKLSQLKETAFDDTSDERAQRQTENGIFSQSGS